MKLDARRVRVLIRRRVNLAVDAALVEPGVDGVDQLPYPTCIVRLVHFCTGANQDVHSLAHRVPENALVDGGRTAGTERCRQRQQAQPRAPRSPSATQTQARHDFHPFARTLAYAFATSKSERVTRVQL